MPGMCYKAHKGERKINVNKTCGIEGEFLDFLDHQLSHDRDTAHVSSKSSYSLVHACIHITLLVYTPLLSAGSYYCTRDYRKYNEWEYIN